MLQKKKTTLQLASAARNQWRKIEVGEKKEREKHVREELQRGREDLLKALAQKVRVFMRRSVECDTYNSAILSRCRGQVIPRICMRMNTA